MTDSTNPTENFDLSAEVERWCRRTVARTQPYPRAVVAGTTDELLDELMDHLHCDIEQRLAAGMDPATAFVRATEAMAGTMDAEQALAQQLHLAAQAPDAQRAADNYTAGELLRFICGYLLLLAFTVAMALTVMGDSEYFLTVLLLLYAIWMPALYLMPIGRAAMRAECRVLRRVYQTLRG